MVRSLSTILGHPSPSREVIVALAIGGDREEVRENIEESPGTTVLRELPYNGLRLRVREPELTKIQSWEAVDSVEIDRPVEIADSGN